MPSRFQVPVKLVDRSLPEIGNLNALAYNPLEVLACARAAARKSHWIETVLLAFA